MATRKLLIAMMLVAAPAVAQTGLTGSWNGTYALSIQLSACQNKTFTWSGNASVTLLQAGSSLTGRSDLTNFTFFNNNCTTTAGEITNDLFGTTDGSTLSLAVLNDPKGWQLTGTVNADSIVLQLSDVNGLTGSLNLARTSGAVPAVDVTGSWSGTYSFTDVCPNGSTKKSYSGSLTLGLTQVGSTAAGVLTITNVPLYDQNCSTIANLTQAMSVAGVVSGSTFTGVAFDPSGLFDFPMAATIGSSGMSGTVAGASPTSTTGTFNLTQSGTQAPASDFSGRYDGTYSESDNGLAFCFNIGTVPFAGTASMSLVQAGTAISGAVILEDTLTIVSDGFGNCAVLNGGEEVLPLYGTLPNGAVRATAPFRAGAIAMTVNLAGDTATGTMTDSFGDVMTFSATRSAAPVLSILSFSAMPSAIVTGQSTTLSWTTSGATSVSIDNGVGSQAFSGSVNLSPAQTTIYTLTATGPSGSVTAQTTVTVSPPLPRRRAAKP